jgi:aryl-alcohol dehydrogenase-like predicted oxidoreductase
MRRVIRHKEIIGTQNKGKKMSEINVRRLGRSGIIVSSMGLGCWAIGGPFWSGETPLGWGKVDDNESIRAILTALDLGITLFDTANVYGAGHSEQVLARAFAGIRSRVVIASKFNSVFDETTCQVTGSDSSPAGIRAACDDSLRRLNTDYIDLYQFHDNGFPADQAEPVRETLESLVKEGKIRAYGWSTDFPKGAEVFAQGPKCSAIQLQLNVLDVNKEVIAICEKYNLAALNRGPLAMGLLTDKYTTETKPSVDDVRGVKSPDWMKYFKDGKPNPEWVSKRNAIREILTSEGRTVAQGALAWLWAYSEKTIPIPGFRTVEQVKENVGAMQFGPLTKKQMIEIDELLERT